MVALPGAVLPGRHAARQGEAARRRVRRDDPLRDRGRSSAPTARGSWCCPDSYEAGRGGRSATCRSATTCSSSRSRPNRPDCLACTASRARCTRSPARRWRPTRRPRTRPAEGEGDADGPDLRDRRRPRALPALQRARVHRRAGRPLAAVAEGAPDGGGPAPDQQRRRHHQLRDAAARPADARLRPRPRRRPRAARARARARASGSTTLDGEQRVFDGDAVLVCDADGPTGIGGDHGRRHAARSRETTTRVAMEAATWNGPNILQTSKKLGLRTRGQRALREAAASASSRCRRSGWRRG